MKRWRLAATLLLLVSGLAQAAKDSAMQTQCFGRFEMQIPEGARVTDFAVSRNGVALSSIAARSVQEAKAAWLKDIEEQRLQTHAKAGNVLIESKAHDPSTFLLAWYDSHASERLARIRLYHHSRQRTYLLEQTGTTASRAARTEQLLRLSQNLRAEPTGQAGVCFAGGFLVAPADAVGESMQVSMELPKHTDVRLTLDTSTNNGELPERMKARLATSGIEREPGFMQVQKLFDERRTFNGISGEAAGYKVPTTATILVHRLAFQSLGIAETDPLRPEITFTLKTGEQRDDAIYPEPGLSDDEARALFDRMLGSLRLRPG